MILRGTTIDDRDLYVIHSSPYLSVYYSRDTILLWDRSNRTTRSVLCTYLLTETLREFFGEPIRAFKVGNRKVKIFVRKALTFCLKYDLYHCVEDDLYRGPE